MIMNGEVFIDTNVDNYYNVGTLDAWREYNNKPTILCDIDGVLIKNKGQYGKNSYHTDYELLHKNHSVLIDKLASGFKIVFVTARKKKYYEKNKHEIHKRRHIFYKNNRQKIDAKNREWMLAHPENRSKHIRTYYLSHKEKMLDYQHNYCKTLKGQLKISRANHTRRSTEKKIPCTLTVKQWKKILDMQDNKCASCKREFTDDLKPTRDHIIPLSKGGGLTFGNTHALCKSCNSSKNDSFDISKSFEQIFDDSIFYMKVGDTGYVRCEFSQEGS